MKHDALLLVGVLLFSACVGVSEAGPGEEEADPAANPAEEELRHEADEVDDALKQLQADLVALDNEARVTTKQLARILQPLQQAYGAAARAQTRLQSISREGWRLRDELAHWDRRLRQAREDEARWWSKGISQLEYLASKGPLVLAVAIVGPETRYFTRSQERHLMEARARISGANDQRRRLEAMLERKRNEGAIAEQQFLVARERYFERQSAAQLEAGPLWEKLLRLSQQTQGRRLAALQGMSLKANILRSADGLARLRTQAERDEERLANLRKMVLEGEYLWFHRGKEIGRLKLLPGGVLEGAPSKGDDDRWHLTDKGLEVLWDGLEWVFLPGPNGTFLGRSTGPGLRNRGRGALLRRIDVGQRDAQGAPLENGEIEDRGTSTEGQADSRQSVPADTPVGGEQEQR